MGTTTIELTPEAQQILENMRTLAEQIGNGVACGLVDHEDDDARFADLFTRFDELVLSWVIA